MTNVYTTIAAIMATGLLLLMQCPGARASSNFSVAPRTLTMHSDGTCECQDFALPHASSTMRQLLSQLETLQSAVQLLLQRVDALEGKNSGHEQQIRALQLSYRLVNSTRFATSTRVSVMDTVSPSWQDIYTFTYRTSNNTRRHLTCFVPLAVSTSTESCTVTMRLVSSSPDFVTFSDVRHSIGISGNAAQNSGTSFVAQDDRAYPLGTTVAYTLQGATTSSSCSLASVDGMELRVEEFAIP